MNKLTIFFLFVPFFAFSQSSIERVEPPFWWTGMNNTELQIMVYGENISELNAKINHKGVSIKETKRVENKNYQFLYLTISPECKAGKMVIHFKNNENKTIEKVNYELKERESTGEEKMGYDNSDVLYLITPDRFVNGNPDNDNNDNLSEKVNRPNKDGRHGGDLQGIVNSLDYLSKIGYTAIWLNPILENNQPEYSYHGYSTTDYYKVDPRYGTNEEYQKLSSIASEKGVKIVMDMIMNHCGSEHWWMKDLPTNDWINNGGKYTQTNHKRTTLRDPYASDYDKKGFTDGWFVETMPDLNQRNPLMATYLIQNTIWWIEYLNLAGIRMDTYPYSDMHFMTDWTCAVMEEYPNFNICGEEWITDPATLAYWQKGKNNPDGYTSCLPGLLDFPIQDALTKGLIESENWNTGLINLYVMLSNDYLYPDPSAHVIFPDNHDMSRIYTQLNEDIGLYKLAMTYFATMRGTPQFYYGTEILMSNTGDDSHGNIRSDYPGGWEGDEINAFTGKGLSKEQIDARNFTTVLLNWRKKATVVHSGKLKHFTPSNGVYVYFRYNDETKTMVVLNKTNETQSIDLKQFEEILPAGSVGQDIFSNQNFKLHGRLEVPAKQPLILEIK